MIKILRDAADPGDSVRRALEGADRPTHLLSIGKAGVEMARAAVDVFGPMPGFVVGPGERVAAWEGAPETLVVCGADHPKPTDRNTAVAERLLAWCETLGASDRLLVLVSGGASAQLTLPVAGVLLEDVAEISDRLMRSGATIVELNSVRKRLDRIKGGRLAVAVAPASSEVLVLSDVLGDPLDVVSSGPMHPDGSTRAEVLEVLDRYGVSELAAARVILVGGAGVEPPAADDPAFGLVRHLVIGNHETLADAAGRLLVREGFAAQTRTMVSGEASSVGRELAERFLQLDTMENEMPAALVWAGETTVSGVGEGARGGPVQEAALACAVRLVAAGLSGWSVVGYASDGIDGPTDAAGAILSDVSALDWNKARDVLARHDVYPVLDAGGALIRSGPTGTNLNDVLVVWRTDGSEGPIDPER